MHGLDGHQALTYVWTALFAQVRSVVGSLFNEDEVWDALERNDWDVDTCIGFLLGECPCACSWD
jgi:hypothetical protein